MANCKIKRVGLFVALPQEAKPIITRLNLLQSDKKSLPLPVDIYEGHFQKIEILLWTAGIDSEKHVPNIGPEFAFASTILLVNDFKPDVVLNPGTAGGFHRRGNKIGDVIFGNSKAMFHDRRSPVKKYQAYQSGNHSVFDGEEIARKLGITLGIVSSGVSFDHNQESLERAFAYGASAIDMEAASCAWACNIGGTKALPIKIITDLVDNDEGFKDQFYKNWLEGCERLGQVVENTLAAFHENIHP